MMELTNKNIEEYINRFLDGETTNAEEQAVFSAQAMCPLT